MNTRLVRAYGKPLAALMALILVVAGVISAAHYALARSSSVPQPSVLRWASEGISDLFTLDPAEGPDFNAREAMQLIYSGLVRFGPGFKITPDAAESWQITGNGRTYIFHIRPDIRFGDGHPLTAQDVAYSLNRILSPRFQANSGAFLVQGIVGAPDVMNGKARTARGIQILDDHTLRIRLSAPDGSFLSKLANPPGYIVPRWRIQANPAHWDEHAVGSGPFMVSRWVHNNVLLLQPNPYFYGGKLHLAGVEMPFIPEPLTAYKRYRAGAVDIMGTVHFPTQMLYDVRSRSDFHRSARLETVYLTLNEQELPFQDARVRRAFAYALDKSRLAQEAFGGFAHPTDAMMPPGLPGYNARISGTAYNPALARKLLADDGYPGGKGLPVIRYPVDQDTQSIVLATALARQWKQVLGVRVQLVQYTHSDYLQLLSAGHYQVAVIDWTADYPDPENFVSQQLQTDSPNNNSHWSNDVFDELTRRADGMPPSKAIRYAFYRRAEEIAMQDAADIPLVNPLAGIMMRSTVHGISITGGYPLVRDWTRVSVGAS